MDLLHVINRLRSDTKIAQNGCDRDTSCDKLYSYIIAQIRKWPISKAKKCMAHVLFAFEIDHFGVGD